MEYRWPKIKLCGCAHGIAMDNGSMETSREVCIGFYKKAFQIWVQHALYRVVNTSVQQADRTGYPESRECVSVGIVQQDALAQGRSSQYDTVVDSECNIPCIFFAAERRRETQIGIAESNIGNLVNTIPCHGRPNYDQSGIFPSIAQRKLVARHTLLPTVLRIGILHAPHLSDTQYNQGERSKQDGT